VVADVPGLIEGAHEGHGLGTRFLAHLERTKVLVHVIDVSEASSRDPIHDFEVIRDELERFAGHDHDTAVALAAKPQIVAANKIDSLHDRGRLDRLAAYLEDRGLPLFPISGVRGEGVPALLEAMWREVARQSEVAAAP
jgi:GTP-binding protein